MEVVANSKFIKKMKCLTKKRKCKYLRPVSGYSPSKGTDVEIYACFSEEETCCGCCRRMEDLE